MYRRSASLARPVGTSRKSPLATYRPLALAVLIGAIPAAASAQDGASQGSLPGWTLLRELLLLDGTAEDVPAAVTVVGAEEIEKKGFTSGEEVLRGTPGVNVNTSGGANISSIYVRGVGALYPMSMDDAFVSVNLDGSPLTSRHLSLGNLDVEYIEVLKGPQGTTFGGLGAAGAINVVTGKPTRHVEGYVRGEIGEEGQRSGSAAVGGPLTSQLSGRLALQISGYDYPITNLQTGAPLSEPDHLGVRASLNWDVGPQTSVLFSGEHHSGRHMGENIVLRPYNDEPLVDATPGIYDYSEKTLDKYAVNITHQFANSQLTSITAYTDMYYIAPVFFDRLISNAVFGSPSEFFRDQESDERVFTQDLRLSSLPDSNISWVAGLSALHSDRTFNHPRQGGANFSVYPGFGQFRDFTREQYGIYGEVTVPVAEQLKAIAGLRQTWEKRTYDATYTSRGVSTPDSDELSESFATGRLGLSYDVTPHTNIFATASRGYNPAGFQDYAEAVGDARYEAGTIYAGELGFKSRLMNDRLRVNGAVFLVDVEDNYLIDSDGVSSEMLNVDTRSLGGELELSVQLNDQLALAGLLSYIKATIESDGNTGFGPVSAGNSVPDVPEWSAKLSLLYETDLPANAFLTAPKLNARLDYTYAGDRPADVQNSFYLDAYHDIGVNLGISNNNAEFYLWGRNLLDEHYDLYGFSGGANNVTYGAPARGRTFGMGFNSTF